MISEWVNMNTFHYDMMVTCQTHTGPMREILPNGQETHKWNSYVDMQLKCGGHVTYYDTQWTETWQNLEGNMQCMYRHMQTRERVSQTRDRNVTAQAERTEIHVTSTWKGELVTTPRTANVPPPGPSSLQCRGLFVWTEAPPKQTTFAFL